MEEREVFDATGRKGATHYQRALLESKLHDIELLGRQSLVHADEMQWEDSPQGRLKHIVNDQMGTREFALDMYIQVIEPGEHSGKHRHFSEEVLYVLEGEGYDLHWDPRFTVDVAYDWSWTEEPRRYDWTADDFIWIPPNVIHQHVAAPNSRARLISATARVIKALGFDGLEQVEPASG